MINRAILIFFILFQEMDFLIYRIRNWFIHNPVVDTVYILVCLRMLFQESNVLHTYFNGQNLVIMDISRT